MRRRVIYALWTLIILSSLTRGRSSLSTSKSLSRSQHSYLFNSFLPPQPKHDHTVVATLDGTLYLFDVTTRKFLWSFATGRPIYSSYQANNGNDNNHNASGMRTDDSLYIDIGEDWDLYVHNGGPLGKMKLPLSIDDYIRKVPYVSNDGGVTLGSKNSTVFVLDAESGKLLNTYQLSDAPTYEIQDAGKSSILLKEDADMLLDSGVEDFKNIKHLLYVIRRDYVLQHKSLSTGKISWNLAFSEIEAEFQCQKHQKSYGWDAHDFANEFGADYTVHVDSHLPCQKKIVVYRTRDSRFTEQYMLDRSKSANYEGHAHLLPSAYEKPDLAAGELYPLALRNHDGSLVPRDKGALALRFDDVLSKNERRLMLDQRSRPNIIGNDLDDRGRRMELALPGTVHENHEVKNDHSHNAGKMNTTSIVNEAISRLHGFPYMSFLVTLLSIVGGVIYCTLSIKRREKSDKQIEESNLQPKMLKRRKARKSTNNKNGAKNDKNQIHMSTESKVEGSHEPTITEGSNTLSWLTYIDNVDYHIDGRRIGKLVVSNKEIAKGSNGTVVLEGLYDGRPVAVKRLVRTHHDVALKEIQNLIISDHHPNIVRWYGVEHDQDFVYLSLERCSCSLSDFIYMYSEPFHCHVSTKNKGAILPKEFNVRSHLVTANSVELWKENGYPSAQLLKLMRDVVSGLAHLHELGIIHRDLKPQNVLIIQEKILCAKISDMGISKRLPEDMSSLTQHQTGYGSSGWQAPEQIRHGRQTRAVDLFSLGCLLFFCVTGGKHPYGDNFERDVNILNNQKDFFLVEHIPEAMDLFSDLLDPNPELRPKASDVLCHPFFWSSETRLSFLRDVSDRVELEDREKESDLLSALESIGAKALGGKWDEKMETVFINNIGSYRRYRFDSVRDLLRVIRNKLNHYRELPGEIQELLGPVPEGYYSYFSSRFPHLLIGVYKVMCRYCKEEEFFGKYNRSNLL